MTRDEAFKIISEYERKFSNVKLQPTLTIQDFSDYNNAKYFLSKKGLKSYGT